MTKDHLPNSLTIGAYPAIRMRRTRAADWSRRLCAETRLNANDLIWAVVVRSGENMEEPVPSMPGVNRLSIDRLVEAAKTARDLGVPAIAIFPYTAAEDRTPDGREALNEDNLMCKAARAVKAAVPDIGLICDVALDPYTDHGHDGLMEGDEIVNDATIEVLIRQSIVQAKAGYDVVAPSDMMDGRIGAIRAALESEGYVNVQIMSYAVKYASAFYGPYRDAIGSKGVLKGDKKTYQMNPANRDEGLREVALDLAEGADSVIVKPGLPYLDMITRVKDAFGVPTMAFQVSGEYAMLTAAGQNGLLDKDAAMMESLACFKRAGADGIISYFALEAARKLNNKN
ncbi:MAG: porphobilinogen synthase [Pseudomonadota bacterium]